MEKTEYVFCVGKKDNADVYLTVFTSKGRYFVKWRNELVDVTSERESFRYASLVK